MATVWRLEAAAPRALPMPAMAQPQPDQAWHALVSAIYGDGDEEVAEVQRRLVAATTGYQQSQRLAAGVRADPGSAYAAADTLAAIGGLVEEYASFQKDSVEATIGPDRLHHATSMKEEAAEKIATMEQEHTARKNDTAAARQRADAQNLPGKTTEFRAQQEAAKSLQEERNELCALTMDPEVVLSLEDLLRRGGEVKTVKIKSQGELLTLRGNLNVDQLTADVFVGGVSLARGMVVLSKETVLMEDGSERPRLFDLLNGPIPDHDFSASATFRRSYTETELQADPTSQEAECTKLIAAVAEDRRAGVEHFACKTETGVSLHAARQVVCSETASIDGHHSDALAMATRAKEDAASMRSKLETLRAEYRAMEQSLKVKLEDCEGIKTDANVRLLQAREQAKRCLMQTLEANEQLRDADARHEHLFCLQDRLESKVEEVGRTCELLDASVEAAQQQIGSMVQRGEELSAEIGTLSADHIGELNGRITGAAEVLQREEWLASEALDRSIQELSRELAVAENEITEAENEQAQLKQKAQVRGRGSMIELRKVSGRVQSLRCREAALDKEQEAAMLLQHSLRDRFSGSDALDAQALNHLTDELDLRLFRGFRELTPEIVPAGVSAVASEPVTTQIVPAGVSAVASGPVTTLCGLGPGLKELIAKEMQQLMQAEKEKWIAEGYKQCMQRQQQSANPPTNSTGSNKQKKTSHKKSQSQGSDEKGEDVGFDCMPCEGSWVVPQ